jgi:hypothetical protein
MSEWKDLTRNLAYVVIISNLIKLSFHEQYKEKLRVCYGKTKCNGYVQQTIVAHVKHYTLISRGEINTIKVVSHNDNHHHHHHHPREHKTRVLQTTIPA